MLGISYTYCGMLCEGLSGHNVDRGYDLLESLPDDRASRDTNLQISFILPQESIFCYFGILNNGYDPPHKRCLGYSFYVRLAFGSNIVITNWISTTRQILVIIAIELRDVEDLLIFTHFKAIESVGYDVVFTF